MSKLGTSILVLFAILQVSASARGRAPEAALRQRPAVDVSRLANALGESVGTSSRVSTAQRMFALYASPRQRLHVFCVSVIFCIFKVCFSDRSDSEASSLSDDLNHLQRFCAFAEHEIFRRPPTVHSASTRPGACCANLRFHLGLLTPPGPVLNVGYTTMQWHEGEVLVFDDTFIHSARHDGTLGHPMIYSGQSSLMLSAFCYPN